MDLPMSYNQFEIFPNMNDSVSYYASSFILCQASIEDLVVDTQFFLEYNYW